MSALLVYCENFLRVHAHVSSQNAASQTPFVALGANPSVFFSSTPSVVFCVSIKKCVMPLVGNHWMNHWPTVVGFKGAGSVGSASEGVLSQHILEQAAGGIGSKG